MSLFVNVEWLLYIRDNFGQVVAISVSQRLCLSLSSLSPLSFSPAEVRLRYYNQDASPERRREAVKREFLHAWRAYET